MATITVCVMTKCAYGDIYRVAMMCMRRFRNGGWWQEIGSRHHKNLTNFFACISASFLMTCVATCHPLPLIPAPCCSLPLLLYRRGIPLAQQTGLGTDNCLQPHQTHPSRSHTPLAFLTKSYTGKPSDGVIPRSAHLGCQTIPSLSFLFL